MPPVLARALAALGLALTLAACTDQYGLDKPTQALGDFSLGHNVVIARSPESLPISRRATEAEWQEILGGAIEQRFSRYQGDKIYHLGISVDGYVLAPPGVPVVLSPKSVLIVTANVFDDARCLKLNPEGEQLTVIEEFSGETIIGSGLTMTKEEQMRDLSASIARSVETWLRKNPQWFGAAPEGAEPAGETGRLLCERGA